MRVVILILAAQAGLAVAQTSIFKGDMEGFTSGQPEGDARTFIFDDDLPDEKWPPRTVATRVTSVSPRSESEGIATQEFTLTSSFVPASTATRSSETAAFVPATPATDMPTPTSQTGPASSDISSGKPAIENKVAIKAGLLWTFVLAADLVARAFGVQLWYVLDISSFCSLSDYTDTNKNNPLHRCDWTTSLFRPSHDFFQWFLHTFSVA